MVTLRQPVSPFYLSFLHFSCTQPWLVPSNLQGRVLKMAAVPAIGSEVTRCVIVPAIGAYSPNFLGEEGALQRAGEVLLHLLGWLQHPLKSLSFPRIPCVRPGLSLTTVSTAFFLELSLSKHHPLA